MRASVWLDAYVLHRRAYRETSYLVDFFTLQTGRISAVARGSRQAKSDRKSLLQPFGPVRLQLAGKSELKTLTQLESGGKPWPLAGNALFCGLYVNEIVNRTLPPGLASEALFDRYQQALAMLATSEPADIALRSFEFALLDEMGQLPDWLTDAHTGAPIEAQRWYVFVPEQGVVSAADPSQPGRLSGQALQQMCAQDWTPAARQAAKWLARQALAPLLGNKPLKSRELFARGLWQ